MHKHASKIYRSEEITERLASNIIMAAAYCIEIDIAKRKIYYANMPDDAKIAENDNEQLKLLRLDNGVVVKRLKNLDPLLLHGLIGKITELGELISALIGAETVDEVNVLEELGDSDTWYLQAMLESLGYTRYTMDRINSLKLDLRYLVADIHGAKRDLSAERALLEQLRASKLTQTIGYWDTTGGRLWFDQVCAADIGSPSGCFTDYLGRKCQIKNYETVRLIDPNGVKWTKTVEEFLNDGI